MRIVLFGCFFVYKRENRNKKVIGGNENEKKWKKNFIDYLDGGDGICIVAGY